MLKLRTILPALCFAALSTTALEKPALANQYEVFIDIDTEEDLYDLRVANVIGDDTFNVLVELLQRGVDLNTATRRTLYTLPNLTYREVDAILDYRKEVGRIQDPASLVVQGILRQDKLNAIAAFLVLRTGSGNTLPASGMARMQTRYSVEDSGAPATALQLRAQGLKNMSAGLVAFNTRLRMGEVRYDPSRDALTAEAPGADARLPKAFVQWEDDTKAFIAGTYRIGFGQRLTFDNTDQKDPDGFYGDYDVFRDNDLSRECRESAGELDISPCSGVAGDIYVTPDYRSRDGLLGAAASIRKIKIGEGEASVHAFGSYQPRSIYQYELYDKGVCDDPTNDQDPNCSAPDVFRTGEDPLAPASKFSFQTLPNVFAEIIGGGHVDYTMGRRTRVGVTGYGSKVDFLVNGMDLDFQEWSSMPYGGNFGAVGVDVSHGIGNTDILAEVSRSFDNTPGSGGGLGAVVRSVTAWDRKELEVSARYYDTNFQNPHARPIAAADEYDGLRARDEAGARVRYTADLSKRLKLRSSLDYWRAMTDGTDELVAFVRGDMDLSDQIRVGLWTQFQDKDLSDSVEIDGMPADQPCFEVSVEDDENGEPIPCTGEKIQLTGRVRLAPTKATWMDLQYQHEFQDDPRVMDGGRQDSSVVAILTTKPHKDFRLRARARYLFEAISDNTYEENSLWTYAEVAYRLRQKDRLRVRYDIYTYFDDRASTLDRQPSPEHWMWMEYQAFF